MKQISLRQFRDSIATLDEPVVVLRRRQAGFDVLGWWTPNGEGALAVALVEATSRAIPGVPRVPAGPSFGVSRPVPKPSQRGSK